MSRNTAGAIAAFRFLAGSGTRLALRVMAPLFAAVAGAGILLGPDFVRSLARVLFGTEQGRQNLAILSSGLLVAAWAAGLITVPAARGVWVRLLAVPAGLLAFHADLFSLSAAATLAFLADRLAGTFEKSAPRKPTFRLRRLPFSLRIAWRATGRKLPGIYLSSLLPLACGWAFVAHNPLSDRHRALGASLAGGLAALLVLAGLAEKLALLRPVWPWARSLPWSARERVSEDALLLGLHALPLLLLAGTIAPPSWALVGALAGQLALLPPLAVLAAAAVRRTPERRTGAAGEILLAGSLAVALTALLPWLALPALSATPWLLGRAALREQRQSVSRWLEIHHLAVGDPQSWSPSDS